MIEGLTAIYGINTQAKFRMANYAHLGAFTRVAIETGCFVTSVPGEAYTVLVLGPLDNVELLALAYPKLLVKQPQPELVG